MLEIIYNKIFISIVVSIILIVIIYSITEKNANITNKKERKDLNKYYVRTFVIIFLIMMIILYSYEYYKKHYNINLRDFFTGGVKVINEEVNQDIKIIDMDIETDLGDWNS